MDCRTTHVSVLHSRDQCFSTSIHVQMLTCGRLIQDRQSSRAFAAVRQSPHVHAFVVFFFRCLCCCFLVAAILQMLHFILRQTLQRKLNLSVMDLGCWLLISNATCFAHWPLWLQAGFRHIVHVVQSGEVQAGFVQSKHRVRRLL